MILQPTYPIHLINTDNASYSCLTAAAGTCIGHNFFLKLVSLFYSMIKLYNYEVTIRISYSYYCSSLQSFTLLC